MNNYEILIKYNDETILQEIIQATLPIMAIAKALDIASVKTKCLLVDGDITVKIHNKGF